MVSLLIFFGIAQPRNGVATALCRRARGKGIDASTQRGGYNDTG